MSSIFRRSSALYRFTSSYIKSLQISNNPTFPFRDNLHNSFSRRALADTGFHCFAPVFLLRNPTRVSESALGFSTSSAAVETVDWNKKWPADTSEESSVEAQCKERGTYITVKAYLLGTSVDLKGLQSEPLFDAVPPNSRNANYVILKCTDNMHDYSSSITTRNGMEAQRESSSNYRTSLLMKMRGIRRMISKLLLRNPKFYIRYVPLRSQPCPAQTFPQLISDHSCADECFVTPKGCCPVDVGKERKRYFVGIPYLNHPLIRALLDKSGEEFGVDHIGVLYIPCDLESFEHVLWLVQSNPNPSYEAADEVFE